MGFTDHKLYKQGISTPPRVSPTNRHRHSNDTAPVDVQVHCCVDNVDCSSAVSGMGTDAAPVTLTVRCKRGGSHSTTHTRRNSVSHQESHSGSSFDPILHANNVDADDNWAKTSQQIKTKSVIVTAPSAVLASGRIKFEPELPELQQQAFTTRTLDSAMKIILKFKKRCWPEGLAGVIMAGAGNSRVKPSQSQSPGADADAPSANTGNTADDELLIPEIWFTDLKTHPRYVQGYIEDETVCYCTAFLTSTYADRVREYAAKQTEGGDGSWNTHDVMYGSVLLQLEEIFGHLLPEHMLPEGVPTADKHIIHLQGGKKEGYQTQRRHLQHSIDTLPNPSENFLGGMVYVWDEESHPFIGGGYSFPRAGTFELGLQRVLSQANANAKFTPIKGLFFAGEGSSRGPGATAHSAIDTGSRAARHVARHVANYLHDVEVDSPENTPGKQDRR